MAAIILLPWVGGAAGGTVHAQTLDQNTISTIAKSDPLIITGAIGTQNTYYNSSVGSGYRSPWANTIYANLNIALYGISMPFSFYYSNNNSSFNYPHLSFHLDPSYKNWKGHLGQSNMALSNYIMNMSFNGMGVEYGAEKLRFGVFYGQLRTAVNDDPTDPQARKPQYSRWGWGFKVGYGSSRTFLDVSMLRAADRLNSIDEYWQNRVSPQDNIAIGLRGGIGLTSWLSLRGNLAFTAFSSDKRADRIHTDQLDRWDKIFEARNTSLMRIATDVSANLNLKGFNSQIIYKMVQPDYTTLGLYYNANNYQSLGINASTSLIPKTTLAVSFCGQEDNITRNQLYTTRGFVYSATASRQFTDRLTLAAGYNGFLQVQGDGKARVNDSIKVHRVMHSLYVTPSYTLDGEHLAQIYSLTANYTQNKDLNKFATGISDVKTLALGLSHHLTIKSWEMDVTTSLSHQQSDGYQTRYITDVLTVGSGRSFLKDKNLQCAASFSLCYNDVKEQQRTLSVGADLSANYMLKKVHMFTLSASFNKFSDTNLSKDLSSIGTTEMQISFGYNYTFSLLEIKKKSRPTPDPSL